MFKILQNIFFSTFPNLETPRHEAAEALANIGGAEARGWLERYTEDPQEEVGAGGGLGVK